MPRMNCPRCRLSWSLVVTTAGLLTGCGPSASPPAALVDEGAIRFAALGDAPYYGLDFPRYRQVLRQIDEAALDVVVHVGDLLWYPCDERTYRDRLEDLQRLRHPVVYTPGDNEWADCHEDIAGAHRPLERLARLREIFFATPGESLGARPIALQSQQLAGDYKEFVENSRWRIGVVVFATVHFPGSWNAGAIYPERDAEDNTAAKRRTAAAVAWIEQAFAEARQGAAALVLATHADMNLVAEADDDYRSSYEPFLERLEALVAAADFAVLLVHGDSHEYLVDQPLHDRRDGRALDNFWRLQIMGTPHIGWVEVSVTGRDDTPFEFTAHSVPWWKLF